MTDYVAVILNGTFTGIGVIIAHEIYDSFKKHREKIKNMLNNNNKKNDD
jgi:hypothetical protein